jgi:hypothetical protein
VDKDEDFVPVADRLGQIHVYEKDLSVNTRGQEFNTAHDAWGGIHADYLANKRDPLLKKGIRIVDDANLLCRYLVGQATLKELEAEASGDQRTVEQILIARLQYEVCLAEQVNANFRFAHAALVAKLTLAEGEIRRLSRIEGDRNDLQAKLDATLVAKTKKALAEFKRWRESRKWLKWSW